jgi:hypothetical protein
VTALVLLAVWVVASLLASLVLARIGYNLKRHRRSNR